MIELFEGFWCDPWDVKAIKAINDDSCLLWLEGQSAMDGFVIEVDANSSVQQILNAREGITNEDDESDEDDE